ncbi:hypothetical protein [Anaerococcus sp. mt242]|uniref:hypothetical protein n=1 Tax=unclassified Anaerococcus TaxID=2614126 RepID=UPI0019332A6E|nr:hypothetical protein [Anaerococcus sp. mt242]MBM0045640.1 hypothetical protein [Anaerococcus sp. mt242]
MKLNKTLASALLLTVTLTGCDNMVKNENKDANAPVVEENKADTAKENQNTADEAKAPEQTAENKAENTEDTQNSADTNENADETTDQSQDTSTADMSADQKIEALEQAIFDNRSSARAVEILFELSPETVSGHEDELNELLETSNSLLEKAQTALDQLKAQ